MFPSPLFLLFTPWRLYFGIERQSFFQFYELKLFHLSSWDMVLELIRGPIFHQLQPEPSPYSHLTEVAGVKISVPAEMHVEYSVMSAPRLDRMELVTVPTSSMEEATVTSSSLTEEALIPRIQSLSLCGFITRAAQDPSSITCPMGGVCTFGWFHQERCLYGLRVAEDVASRRRF